MKRLPLILLLVLVIAYPVGAQPVMPTYLDWIPADFTAFVRVDLRNPQLAATNLNLSLFVASVLQPARVQVTQRLPLDSFFPLDTFDVEGASFQQQILPWLEGEVVIAYRDLDAAYETAGEDTLLILPTSDAFASASALDDVIQGQDRLRRQTYRDMRIYVGDRTAIVFTPQAVLVGQEDALHAAIDRMLGEGDAFTADQAYGQVRAALADDAPVFAYLKGQAAAYSLNALLGGGEQADPLLAALGDALADDAGMLKPLLLGDVDGIGIQLTPDGANLRDVRARVVFHADDAERQEMSDFDDAVLELIPRSAIVVHSGSDARVLARNALTALPLFAYAPTALGAFPLPSISGDTLPVPTADDLRASVESFFSAARAGLDVDVQGDLFERLQGSYALALIPRPNDPVPALNTPYELLLVAQVDAPETVVGSLTALVEGLLDAPLDEETLDDGAFRTLATGAGDALLRIGAVDDLLVMGTGDAVQWALRAHRGDNRLIDQGRWQILSGDEIPAVYVDIPAFYNTFLPSQGGSVVSTVSQMGLYWHLLEDGLFETRLVVNLS